MSRKEAVLLVSRALAMIQLITAFIEATVLPRCFLSLHRYTSRISAGAATQSDYYFKSYDQIEIASIFARIAGVLLFAFLFWNCGPWIERALLPKSEEQSEPT